MAHRISWVVAAVIAVIVAAHVGVIGFAVSHWGWSLGAIVAVVAAKALAVAGYHGFRSHYGRKPGKDFGTHR